MTFSLDPRLARDGIIIGSNEHNLLLMMNDARYPWFIVVPRLASACEWFDLTPEQQIQLHRDCMELGRCVRSAFHCDKINIGALGNIVKQLHIHVLGRYESDPAWPGPVWGHSPAVPYTENDKQHRIEQLFKQERFPFSTA